MIKVSVLYPAGDGKQFDHDYYAGSHFALVRDRLGPMGLVRTEIEKGIGTMEPGAPAPFVAIGNLYFETLEQVQTGFEAHGEELMADFPNYADIEPQIQISELVE